MSRGFVIAQEWWKATLSSHLSHFPFRHKPLYYSSWNRRRCYMGQSYMCAFSDIAAHMVRWTPLWHIDCGPFANYIQPFLSLFLILVQAFSLLLFLLYILGIHIYSFLAHLSKQKFNSQYSSWTTAKKHLVTGHWQFLIVFTQSANADAVRQGGR